MRIALVLLIMFSLVMLGYTIQRPPAQPESGPKVKGISWDERQWTMIPIPPGILLCERDGNGVRCIVPTDGSLIFIPVPQEDK